VSNGEHTYLLQTCALYLLMLTFSLTLNYKMEPRDTEILFLSSVDFNSRFR